ncbi:MAG: hypothetical protein K6G60_08955 [Lachnospiraceae bacterium]|nr:hypothetical protein [Lachnospiraceae bacterium]
MRGLDISSTQYLEMNYFIDSLMTDHEAFILYIDNRLSSLGISREDYENPDFSSKDHPESPLINDLLDKRRKMSETITKIGLLKEYYLNLLSISEFVLYNSSEHKDDYSEMNISGQSYRKLKIQELERSKISSDLHDSSIQILTGLVHKCELIQKLLDIDVSRVKIEISSVIEDLKRSISDLRSLIFNLRAPSFMDFSLRESIEDFCSYKNKDRKVSVVVLSEGDENDLLPIVKSNLYRICQEAFSNILSHADASRAKIFIRYSTDEILLNITDNGVGIDEELFLNNSLGKKNFGLLIMKERAEILGGRFEVFSPETGGTEIRVFIPRFPEGV